MLNGASQHTSCAPACKLAYQQQAWRDLFGVELGVFDMPHAGL